MAILKINLNTIMINEYQYILLYYNKFSLIFSFKQCKIHVVYYWKYYKNVLYYIIYNLWFSYASKFIIITISLVYQYIAYLMSTKAAYIQIIYFLNILLIQMWLY